VLGFCADYEISGSTGLDAVVPGDIGGGVRVGEQYRPDGTIGGSADIHPGRGCVQGRATLKLIGPIDDRRTGDLNIGRIRHVHAGNPENGSRIERIGSGQKLMRIRRPISIRIVRGARVVAGLAQGMSKVPQPPPVRQAVGIADDIGDFSHLNARSPGVVHDGGEEHLQLRVW